MPFVDHLKKTLQESYQFTYTENGALGYGTTGKQLLDLNFAVASLRSQSEQQIVQQFSTAFYEDKRLAVKWLFWAADVREGLGERRLFRCCMNYLAENQPKIAKAVLPYIPEYSRWDNLLGLLDTGLEAEVVLLIKAQLEKDMEQMARDGSISLCAKWLPSINASSAETKRHAHHLAARLSLTEGAYRKMLSSLRNYLRIVETNMSNGRWEAINYAAVPSRANLIYNQAFLRHDEGRRRLFLERVKKGEAGLHAGVLYPHDIVHHYYEKQDQHWAKKLKPEDDTLEELWKALPDFTSGQSYQDSLPKEAGSTLCVADGSGSMLVTVGKSGVSCLEVANALAIYFAGHCHGPYRDKYITFSRNPQFVDLSAGNTLREKITIAGNYNEAANTDIEAVFDLILRTAILNGLSQKELPSNVLVLSDMEFDSAAEFGQSDGNSRVRWGTAAPETLFGGIERHYKEAGYCLPRLIFWNIASRTQTVPIRENAAGVALVSGFSVNIVKMVLFGDTDPYQSLLRQLNCARYEVIDAAIASLI